MPTEMFMVSKADLDELLDQIKLLNENLARINHTQNKEEYLTRPEIEEQFGLSRYEVSKLFNRVLRDKVIKLGRQHRIAKSNIEEAFKNGINLRR